MWAYGLRYSEGRGGSAQAGDKAQRRGRSKSVMTPCLAFSKSIMVEFWSSCHEFVLRKIEALPEVTIMVNSYHLGLKKWITITLYCNTFFGQGNQIKQFLGVTIGINNLILSMSWTQIYVGSSYKDICTFTFIICSLLIKCLFQEDYIFFLHVQFDSTLLTFFLVI